MPNEPHDPEAAAYRILREVLFDLSQAERALARHEAAAPNAERAGHLGAICSAIAELRRVVPTA